MCQACTQAISDGTWGGGLTSSHTACADTDSDAGANMSLVCAGDHTGLSRPCYFIDKAYHAQAAGADALLVVNDNPGDLSTAVAPKDEDSSRWEPASPVTPVCAQAAAACSQPQPAARPLTSQQRDLHLAKQLTWRVHASAAFCAAGSWPRSQFLPAC